MTKEDTKAAASVVLIAGYHAKAGKLLTAVLDHLETIRPDMKLLLEEYKTEFFVELAKEFTFAEAKKLVFESASKMDINYDENGTPYLPALDSGFLSDSVEEP